MVKQSRIAYLDVAKALAMFLVVLGHIIVTYDSRGYNAPVAQGIYSFHTALFMFLSGYFFQSSLNKNLKTLVFAKSRQLLLPYFTWSVVCLLLIEIPTTGFNISGCLTDFCMGGAFRNYWYVKLLFVYIILTWLLIKLFRNMWLGCVMSWLLFTLLPDFSFSSIFIPFFLTGFMCRPFLENRGNWKRIVGLIVALVVMFVFWNPSYNYISLNMEVIPYIIRTMIGIMVSLFVVLTTKHLIDGKSNKKAESIAHLGTITLGIYLCHDLFYRGMVKEWLSFLLPENNILIYILVAFCTFAISVMIVTLLEKNKLLSLLFLGNKYNKNR